MDEINPIRDRLIGLCLEEDLGFGDVTTELIIDPSTLGKGVLLAREPLVLAGLPVFKRVFRALCPEMAFEDYAADGDLVPAEKNICLLEGALSSMLKAERTALNFLQRMSGIATLTRQYVEKVRPYHVRILDTRKTAPGLRWFDKYAVRMGGGFNHRFGLSDGILIKDNHIAAAGSIGRAVERVRMKAPHTLKIEVEVEDLAGTEEALRAGADAVLLDNMSPAQIEEAVRLLKGKVLIEASGGITLETVEETAKAGVDLISVGALTHSPRAVDLSLEIVQGNFSP